MPARRSVRLKDPGGNYDALDFAGALVDFGDARVAIHALDGILATVTVAAVNLNRLVGDARGHLAGKELGGGSLHREAPAGVLFPRRFAYEKPRRVNFSRHIGEHELNGLKISDRVPEGLALLGIGE